ncbi:hypothetical protein [Streptomyces tubercidicus]
MLPYVLTSAAVIVFFRRTRLDTRLWHTLIAPVASIVLLLGATSLPFNNFTVLIGASQGTALILEAVVVLVFLGGVALR